jgi:hypothetical protein
LALNNNHSLTDFKFVQYSIIDEYFCLRTEMSDKQACASYEVQKVVGLLKEESPDSYNKLSIDTPYHG